MRRRSCLPEAILQWISQGREVLDGCKAGAGRKSGSL